MNKELEERLNKKADFLANDFISEDENAKVSLPFVFLIKDNPEKLAKYESVMDRLIELKKEMNEIDFEKRKNGGITQLTFEVEFLMVSGHESYLNTID